MKYQLTRPLSIMGSRFERGAVVELSDELAKAFDPADIAPYTPSNENDGALETEPATTGEQETAEVEVPVKAKAKAKRKA